MSGSEPVHVPTEAESTEPTRSVPVTNGRLVLAGGVPASTAVAFETAVAEPNTFVCVTATRSREPMSAPVGV